MRGVRIAVVAIAAATAATALSALPAVPAGAVGAGEVHFEVHGDLDKFPCETDCLPTQFTGTGDGSGRVTKTVDGDTFDATFTIIDGAVNGTAIYDEPGEPACPLFGNAQGSVTLSEGTGSTTGIIRRTSTPTLAGTVHDATTTINFFYQRVGVNAVVTITGGKVTVEYTYGGVPGTLT